MRLVIGFGRFWWDFIIGDDWRIAAGVAVVLAVGAVLVAASGLSDTTISVTTGAGIVAVAIAIIVGRTAETIDRPRGAGRGRAVKSARRVNLHPDRGMGTAASCEPCCSTSSSQCPQDAPKHDKTRARRARAVLGMPSAYYLAAIAAVLHSGVGTGTQIGALLVFNIVAFSVAEVPLVSFAVRQRRRVHASISFTPGPAPTSGSL